MTPATQARARRPLALLFDLDGTLVDSVELILSSFRHACASTIGRTPPDDEWLEGMGMPLRVQARRFAGSDAEADALVAAYRTFQHAHHDRLIRRFDGALDTLETLRALGHPMGLVTGKVTALAVRALEYAGMRELMTVLVGADSCEQHKPDPEPVRLALRGLGYAPHEALFLGDAPADIVSGNAAGVVTVAALWGPFSRETLAASGPNHFLDDIRDLPALVDRIGNTR
jgi:pyrophosphatase PpaX